MLFRYVRAKVCIFVCALHDCTFRVIATSSQGTFVDNCAARTRGSLTHAATLSFTSTRTGPSTSHLDIIPVVEPLQNTSDLRSSNRTSRSRRFRTDGLNSSRLMKWKFGTSTTDSSVKQFTLIECARMKMFMDFNSCCSSRGRDASASITHRSRIATSFRSPRFFRCSTATSRRNRRALLK